MYAPMQVETSIITKTQPIEVPVMADSGNNRRIKTVAAIHKKKSMIKFPIKRSFRLFTLKKRKNCLKRLSLISSEIKSKGR